MRTAAPAVSLFFGHSPNTSSLHREAMDFESSLLAELREAAESDQVLLFRQILTDVPDAAFESEDFMKWWIALSNQVAGLSQRPRSIVSDLLLLLDMRALISCLPTRCTSDPITDIRSNNLLEEGRLAKHVMRQLKTGHPLPLSVWIHCPCNDVCRATPLLTGADAV